MLATAEKRNWHQLNIHTSTPNLSNLIKLIKFMFAVKYPRQIYPNRSAIDIRLLNCNWKTWFAWVCVCAWLSISVGLPINNNTNYYLEFVKYINYNQICINKDRKIFFCHVFSSSLFLPSYLLFSLHIPSIAWLCMRYTATTVAFIIFF